MKSFRLLLLIFMMATISALQAQNVTLIISGHVTDIQNQQPITGHMVFVTLYADSINTLGSIDSAYTDNAGYYSVDVTSNFVQGTALTLSAGTFDCQYVLQSQYFTYTGGSDTLTADFVICNDSVPPPAGCNNVIAVSGIQGLTVSFSGYLENPQPASYTWEFGDGVTATGENPIHTYAAQGIYTVTLLTITEDSCTDISMYDLVLQDSIPVGCLSFFTYSPTGTPLQIFFEGYTMSQYQTYYSWDFGDPASGTANTSNLRFPYHIFTSTGDYNVTLSTVDSIGCSYTSTNIVTVTQGNQGTLTIYGLVTAGNSYLDNGTATLFSNDSLGAFNLLQVTTIDSAGFYGFYNLTEGSYLVLASPSVGSAYYNQFLPTYYGDVFQWEIAMPIVLGIPQNPYNINLVTYDSLGYGDGSINGQLVSGGKSVTLSQQEVFLLDADGAPVRFTYTDEQGNFNFSSLPMGLYKVNPVITGFTTFPALVDLNSTNVAANVVMTIDGYTITGIKENIQAASESGIYPNPAYSQLNIIVNSGLQGSAVINILDISGRVVLTDQSNVMPGIPVCLDISNLKSGIYFLEMRAVNGHYSATRFVKK